MFLTVLFQSVLAEAFPVGVEVFMGLIEGDSGELFKEKECTATYFEILSAVIVAHQSVVRREVQSYLIFIKEIDARNQSLDRWCQGRSLHGFVYSDFICRKVSFVPFPGFLYRDIFFIQNIDIGMGAYKDGVIDSIELEHITSAAS